MLGSLPLLVFGFFFVTIGWSSYFGVRRRLAHIHGAENWPTAMGQIIENDLLRRFHKGNERFKPAFRYHYEVEGQSYVLSTIKLIGGERWLASADANRRAAEYPLGATGAVYYHPADPETAYVEYVAPTSLGIAMITVPGGYTAMGILMIGLGLARMV